MCAYGKLYSEPDTETIKNDPRPSHFSGDRKLSVPGETPRFCLDGEGFSALARKLYVIM